MINVGDKFRIMWADSVESSPVWTLLLKADGLWWAKNHKGMTIGFNPLSSAIDIIIKEE